MMVSCKKASELTEKKSLGQLSIMERFQLRVHTKICGACNHYHHQSEMIDQALERFYKKSAEQKLSLTEEKKQEIINAINK